MVQAIDPSSSSSGGAASAAASAGALQAQLDQYQHQLSDCVNCDSAKTPEGKQQIAEISSKIGSIRQAIESRQAAASPTTVNKSNQVNAVNGVNANNPVTAVNHASTINSATHSTQAAQNQISVNAVQPPVAANLTVGVNINLYS
ncbi:hypothetical protein ACO0KY_02330 [Undibacterium sp. Dicai25W]|uniref:hypothetical protein n=1 Tax=Undibacterium sp. Dicai25W TaxID=3413034 RepID=UPI003BF32A6D